MLTPRMTVRRIGLAGGPLLAVLCYAALPPTYEAAGAVVEFSREGRVTLSVLAWMAAWWLTEAIDISATALLPVVLLPLSGAATIAQATAPYADDLIFLFLGGFLLALSMQRWGLDRRIALLTLRLVGTRPAAMVGGVMAATGAISLFVSNTATAAMMLPIALGVVRLLEGSLEASPRHRANFAACMLLGMAYAASIGGMGTIIGTPPNGVLVGFIEREYGREIGFLAWLRVGLPMVSILLPVTWLLLTAVLFPVSRDRLSGAAELIRDEYAQLGPVKRGEWATMVAFALAAAAWMLRPLLSRIVPGISDAGIAIAASLGLFLVPVAAPAGSGAPAGKGGGGVLDWATASRVPWGILILFGGGLSIAVAVRANDVAEFIGHQAAAFAGGAGAAPLVTVLVVTVLTVLLSELASNTATAAALVPILAGIAPGLGLHPYVLIVPAALAASCGFMLPVATPPNAMVFASGHVTVRQMIRAGIWLDLISSALIAAAAFTIVPALIQD